MNRQAIALAIGLLATNAIFAGNPSLPVTATTVNEGYEVSWDPNPASDDYFPSGKAIAAALALDRDGASGPGNPRGYHEGFANYLFLSPYFSEQPKSMYIYDCKDSDGCDNGFATVAAILMPVTEYAGVSDACTAVVIGHELFHHVEFAYAELLGGSGCGGIWGNTVCEGQARSMQDKVFTIHDLLPTASCVAPYLGEVNNYLKNTNQSIWLASYGAALWWTYLTEQYGINAQEPGLGVDFLTLWWGRALAAGLDGADALAITDATIKLFDPADSVYAAFRHFAIANLVKDFDLSNASEGFVDRYSYRDEDPQNGFNMMNYNNVTVDLEIGPIGQGQEVTQLMGVQYFGSRYLKADISTCPANKIIRVEIDAANTVPSGADNVAGYGIIVNRDNRPQQFYKKFDTDWTVTTFQSSNPFDELYLVVAPISGFWLGNVTVSCQAPESNFDVDFPVVGPSNPSHGGSPANPSTIAVAVNPTTTEPNRVRGLSGLSALQFEATVGGVSATVLEAIPDRAGYVLQIQLPQQDGPGQYDLAISAGEAIEVAEMAVAYADSLAPEVILAVDTSTSMLSPPDGSRLQAVRQAGVHFIDQLDNVAQVGVVDFRGDGNEPNDDGRILAPLAATDATHIGRIKTAIANLSSGAQLSSAIGDGLNTAYTMFLANGQPVRAWHTVLIVDGPENEADLWQDLRDTIIGSGMTVHTVALGPLADQSLLAEIAHATGGEFRYAEVQPLFAEVLDLHAALGQIADVIQRRTITQSESVVLNASDVLTIDIPVAQDTVGDAVISARVATSLFSPPALAGATLLRPDGSPVSARDGDFVVQNNASDLSFVGQLAKGTWKLELTATPNANNTATDVVVSVPDEGLSAQVGFFRPEVDDEVLTAFSAGRPVGAAVSVADGRGLKQLSRLDVSIEMPDGEVQVINVPVAAEQAAATERTRVDEAVGPASIGFYFMTSNGSTAALPDDGFSGRRGTYQLRLDATLDDGRRMVFHEAVHVLQAASPADRDGDQLPDDYEDSQDCLDGDVDDATSDGDGDLLLNVEEYQRGTLPCRVDSDDGGEIDGSEVAHGRNPLDGEDDALPRPLDGHVVTRRSEHETVEALTANAITVRLPGMHKYHNLTLKRGITSDSLQPLAVFAVGDPQSREYVDTAVRLGREYFYQFEGRLDDGSQSAPGRIFSGFALPDSNAPLGAVNIDHYQLRSDAGSARVVHSLYNESPATTEYRSQSDGAAYGPWLPYVENWAISFDPVAVPTVRTVAVQFRDAHGNVSTDYTDDIVQWPAGSLGRISGQVTLSGPEALKGILVAVRDDPLQKPALTDSNGNFLLSGLEPGTYELEMSRLDYASVFMSSVTVEAGATTTMDPQVMLPPGEFLFDDGFESP